MQHLFLGDFLEKRIVFSIEKGRNEDINSIDQNNDRNVVRSDIEQKLKRIEIQQKIQRTLENSSNVDDYDRLLEEEGLYAFDSKEFLEYMLGIKLVKGLIVIGGKAVNKIQYLIRRQKVLRQRKIMRYKRKYEQSQKGELSRSIHSAKVLRESAKHVINWGEKPVKYSHARTYMCGATERIAVERLKKGLFVRFTNNGERFLLNYSKNGHMDNPIAIRLSDRKIFYTQMTPDGRIQLASGSVPRIFNENKTISKAEMDVLHDVFGL